MPMDRRFTEKMTEKNIYCKCFVYEESGGPYTEGDVYENEDHKTFVIRSRSLSHFFRTRTLKKKGKFESFYM